MILIQYSRDDSRYFCFAFFLDDHTHFVATEYTGRIFIQHYFGKFWLYSNFSILFRQPLLMTITSRLGRRIPQFWESDPPPP